MILDNFGKIMTVILFAVFGYFWFFRRESLKSYMHAKNAEIEAKMQKRQEKLKK